MWSDPGVEKQRTKILMHKVYRSHLQVKYGKQSRAYALILSQSAASHGAAAIHPACNNLCLQCRSAVIGGYTRDQNRKYVSAEDDDAVKDCRVCLLIFDSETNQPAPSLIDMSQALRTGGSD